jgi:hypothetical protein
MEFYQIKPLLLTIMLVIHLYIFIWAVIQYQRVLDLFVISVGQYYGLADELRVFSREITAAEVYALAHP